MAASSSTPGPQVAALTALALAVVGFFGYQASAAAPDAPAAARPSAVGETPADADADPGAGEPAEEAEDDTPAVPAGSGQGTRVVYSVGQGRVWLVQVSDDGLREEVHRSYPVHRSAVSPEPGAYEVGSRTGEITGSDGVPIEHVVVFSAPPDDVVFGFSTAVDGSTPDPAAESRTGGIRQAAEDGDAMWRFATIGVAIVVVP